MGAQLASTSWARVLLLVPAAVAVGLLAAVNPKLAIAAALGCGFLLLALADLPAATAIFGFLSFIEVVPLAGSVVDVTKLAGLVLMLSWISYVTAREGSTGNFLSAFPFVTFLLILFLLWSLVSVLWAENETVALSSTGRYALNAALFLIVFAAVRNPKDLQRMVIAFLAGACVAAAYGLITPSGEIELGRLGSSVLDPNQLASVVVAALPLAAALAVVYKPEPVARLACLLAGAFCLAALFLTVSRGGLIALGASLVAAIFLGGRWRAQISVVGIAVVVATAGYFTFLAPEEALHRITQTTRGEAEVTEGRTTIWQVAWRTFEANPIKGVGAGNFQDAAPRYLLQPGALGRSDTIIDQPSATHNSYLQILAEGGVIGLSLFLALSAFSLGAAIRAASRFAQMQNVPLEAIVRAISIALIGTLVADFFLSQQFSKQLWLLMGIGPACLALARSMDDTADAKE